MLLDIAEVARQSGLPPSTLRFYEREGLIASVARHGLRRQFQPQVLQQLALITVGRTAGFSLAEIQPMLGSDGAVQIDRQALLRKSQDLDHNIRQLLALRDGLRHVAQCPAASHLECPKFQQILRVLGKRLSA